MKQVLQDLRSGEVQVADVPEPQPRTGYALVAVSHSLISSGTERAVVDLGSKSLVQKARARPDLVRKTVDVARSEGVGGAITKLRARLGEYTELGYSCAGTVIDSGGDPRLVPGALVACVGSGYACHADVVSVPVNLVVPLPMGVATADAAFVAPAAIALHGLRLANVQAGSVVAVIGLGLIGQLAGRLLAASGCTAVGTDPRSERCVLFGRAAAADEIAALVADVSRGRGADAVVVSAATSSSGPLDLASDLCRDRASVVVIGDVGLELERRTFYEKELSLVVARSYGAGRYDRAYEEGGRDLPAGYVRWTEGRNVEAVLDLLAAGALRVDDLVTHRYAIADGEDAYRTLDESPDAIGILLEFSPGDERVTSVAVSQKASRNGELRIGIIGGGSFARATLIPALSKIEGVEIVAACARSGASARSLADRFEIPVATTDWRDVVGSEDVDALVIATPHDAHAEMAAAGLEAGKAVFVEKPLAIDWDGLQRVARSPGLLLVGHNRRFAPLAQKLHASISGPVLIQIRVAAGSVQPGHWLNDPEQGGQVIGEISHFVDLASYFAGGPPTVVTASSAGGSMLASLRFENGSAASIVYSVGESGRLPKERVEVMSSAGAAVLDDFSRLDLYGAAHGTTKGRRDKGHAEQLRAFVSAARGQEPLPVSTDEQLLVAAASLALLDSARTGGPVEVTSASVTGLGRYAHALRVSRPRQLVNRLTRPARRRRFPSPASRAAFRSLEPEFWQSAAFGGSDGVAGPGEVRILGKSFPFPPPDWALPGEPRLRRFHIQYGDDVLGWARRGDTRAASDGLGAWIAANPPRLGDAWHPYPVSTRVGNWIAAMSIAPELATGPAVDSLRRQLAFLERNVEDDILGNHVIRNARALVLGGVAFDDGSLLDRGLALLRREVPEQVLSDGGHYERSPVYHLVVLRDLLEVRAATGVSWLDEPIERMRQFSAALARPDGNPALFNDGALDLAPRLDLPEPPKGLAVFPETGYAVLREGPVWLAFDCGPPSPRFLPAHAHADVLSFQLWFEQRPVIIDPGTYTYEPGDVRNWFRSTPAHSTIAVGGRDQFELWGAFRAGRLPSVRLISTSPLEAEVILENGRHRRSLSLDGSSLARERFRRSKRRSTDSQLASSRARSGRRHRAGRARRALAARRLARREDVRARTDFDRAE